MLYEKMYTHHWQIDTLTNVIVATIQFQAIHVNEASRVIICFSNETQ